MDKFENPSKGKAMKNNFKNKPLQPDYIGYFKDMELGKERRIALWHDKDGNINVCVTEIIDRLSIDKSNNVVTVDNSQDKLF